MNVSDLALKHIGQRLRVTEPDLHVEGTLLYFKPLTTIIHDPSIIEPDHQQATLDAVIVHLGDGIFHLELDATIELVHDAPPPIPAHEHASNRGNQ